MELNRRAFLASIVSTPLIARAIPCSQSPRLGSIAAALDVPSSLVKADLQAAAYHIERLSFRTRWSDIALGKSVELISPGAQGRYVVTGMEITREFEIIVTAERRIKA